MPYRVLFVCTANICRSPVAEALFAQIVADHDVEICSAGTAAMVGHAVDESCALALRAVGIEHFSHVAQRLRADMISDADLVLTAEGTHRAAVLRMSPLALRRTFTIREFTRLARVGQVRAEGFATPESRVEFVASLRGQASPPAVGDDDVPDPYGASQEVANATTSLLRDELILVARVLGFVDEAS